jgi:hypothetical protein
MSGKLRFDDFYREFNNSYFGQNAIDATFSDEEIFFFAAINDILAYSGETPTGGAPHSYRRGIVEESVVGNVVELTRLHPDMAGHVRIPLEQAFDTRCRLSFFCGAAAVW